MNRDYKIAVVVGLGILIVGGAWLIFFGGEETTPAPPVPPKPAPHKAVFVEDGDEDTTPVVATVDPPTESSRSWELGEPGEGTAADTSGSESSGTEYTGDEMTGTSDPKPLTTRDPDADPKPLTTRDPDADPKPIITTGYGDTTPTVTRDSVPPDDSTIPPPIAAGTAATYTVVAGDNGLWMIAEKVYGRGKGHHWRLIAEANPTVRSESLRVGMVLKTPPLPTATTDVAVARDPANFGNVLIQPGGQTIYVVAKGDNGLWGIAAKPEVYGNGTLWKLLEKANPSVDPLRLQPGDRLVIPPKPVRAATATPAAAAASEHGKVTTDPSGRDVYIVARGDNGFWGISKKVYGNGKFFPILQKANPNIDPVSMQPGDKIIVPPKPIVAQPTSTRVSTEASRTRTIVIPPDEPDFGPE